MEAEQICELLAPAGSLETFYGVLNAGADGVYLGGDKFGARAYAGNFTTAQILTALDYAHLKGKKVFLTVNTLLKENELEQQLIPYLIPLYENGLDGVIIQDMGVLSLIRDELKGLPLHASTQMSISSVNGARMLCDLGVTRVVMSRELSLSEIREIHENVPIEIESFIHGALCYCYSGQCLMSSMIGGRSGNRGRCAQPCRLPYEVLDEKGSEILEKSHILSPKDLCTIELLPQLIESGITSLKIEGRMKQTTYAAGVVSIYRKYMDSYRESGALNYHVTSEDYNELLQYGNRSGFTEGFYHHHNEKTMITFESPSHNSKRDVDAHPFKTQPEQLPICGELSLKIGQPSKLVLIQGKTSITSMGDVVQKASRQPLGEDELHRRICKTGNTNFKFQSLQMDCDSEIFLPIGKINELRRNGLEHLQKECLQSYMRTYIKEPIAAPVKKEDTSSLPKNLALSLEDVSVLEEGLNRPFVDSIYLDSICFQRKDFVFSLKQAVEAITKTGKAPYLILPGIFRQDAAIFFESIWNELSLLPLHGFVAKSYDSFAFLVKKKKQSVGGWAIITDSCLYAYSNRAAGFFMDIGSSFTTVPAELNKYELLCIGNHKEKELLIYGYLPLMTSAHCIHKNTASCDKTAQHLYLKDRYGYKFPVTNYCDFCYNIIYNSQPLSLFHMREEVEKLEFVRYRIHFSRESAKEAGKILDCYESMYIKKEIPPKNGCMKEYTNGHFKRGVE